MFKGMVKVDYSEMETDVEFDSTLKEIQVNCGGYEELILRLSEKQLQSLFNQMAEVGYNDLYQEKLFEVEKKLEEAEDHIAELEEIVYR